MINYQTDRNSLIALDDKEHENYVANEPGSHIVIDDFFDPKALSEVLAEVDAVDLSKRYAKFFDRETDHNRFAFFSDVAGPNTARLAQCLNSGPFLAYLEKLTGIPNLIADPSYFGLEGRVRRGSGIVGSPDYDKAQGGRPSVQSDRDFFHRERSAARTSNAVEHTVRCRPSITGALLLHQYLGASGARAHHLVLRLPKAQSENPGLEDRAGFYSRSYSTDLSQDIPSDQARDQG